MSTPAKKENGEPPSLSESFKDKYEGTIIDEMENEIKSDSPPKLVISVIGDSVDYTPNSWPTHRFKQALIHAIKTFGDSWILCECNTDIDNAGRVSRTVSQALREYLQVPWQQMEEQSAAYLYKIWNPEVNNCPKEDEECFKDLVLKDSKPVSDHMINIVNKLSEQHVRAFYLETSYRMVLPVIIVVVEGDYETIKIVQKAVDKFIPVILVKGSGMAADLIHYCLEQDKEIKDIPNLMQKIALLFGEKTEAWSDKKLSDQDRQQVLQEIVNKQNLLMSFDVYEDTPETFAEKAKQIILTSWALQSRVLTKIEPAEPPATSGSQNTTANSKTETPAAVQGQNNKSGINKVHPEQSATSVSQNTTENGMAAVPDAFQYESLETPATKPVQDKTPQADEIILDTESKTKAKSSSPLAFYLFYQRLQTEKHRLKNKNSTVQKDVITHVENIQIEESLMMEALIAGEHEFVDVLMDFGATEKMHINFQTLYDQTPGNLKMILKLDTYNGWNDETKNMDKGQTSEHEEDKSGELGKKTDKGKQESEKENGKNEKKLDKNKSQEELEIEKGKSAEERIEKCPAAQRLKELLRNYNAYKIPYKEINYEITERLLLWAVQTNRVKMAEMLWKKTQYPILTALVASELLRKMSRKAWDNKEATLSNDLKEHSDIFCQRAVDTAETFHKQHKNYAEHALAKQYYVWGVYESPIDFAMKYRKYTFVASEVVQAHFHAKWYGNRTYRTWRHLYLICCKRDRKFSTIFSATLTSFSVHYFFFILFLLCLSAFVLSNLKEVMPWNERSVYEYLTYIWITGDFIEEYKSALIVIRDSQLRKKPRECFRAWLRGLYLHFNDFWNLLDFAGYVLIIIAVAFRFQEKEEFEDITRQLFSFTMYIMYMRFLHVLLVSRSIGITIIMLKEALKELIRFIVIAAVFVISTGVFYHANLYPNHYDLFSTFGVRHWSFWRILYLPFWAIFGEFKEELEGVGEEGCSNNETVYVNEINVERCPQKDFLVSVMSGVYTMIASLLLVNLIIAMFTFRFEEIKNNSEKLWRFHRSKVIEEFEGRLPSPFNFVLNFAFIAKWIVNCNKRKDLDKNERIKDIQKIIAKRWKKSDKEVREKLRKNKVEKKSIDIVYIKLKGRRKTSMEEIEQRLKDLRKKKTEDTEERVENQKKESDKDSIKKTTKYMEEVIEKQWKDSLKDLHCEEISNNKKIMASLEDHLKNIAKEVKKRWNREKDLQNIQRTIAERWEKKDSL